MGMPEDDHIGSRKIHSEVVVIAFEEVAMGEISPFIHHIVEHGPVPVRQGDFNVVGVKGGGPRQLHAEEPIPIALHHGDGSDLLQCFDYLPGRDIPGMQDSIQIRSPGTPPGFLPGGFFTRSGIWVSAITPKRTASVCGKAIRYFLFQRTEMVPGQKNTQCV